VSDCCLKTGGTDSIWAGAAIMPSRHVLLDQPIESVGRNLSPFFLVGVGEGWGLRVCTGRSWVGREAALEMPHCSMS
jgi:hypothetical protein